MQNTNNFANTNPTTSNNPSLFEMRQRQYDGAWEIWVQRDELSLGILDAKQYEAAGRPAYMNQTRWVIAKVFQTKPSVDTVLSALGLKKTSPKKYAGNTQQKAA